MTEGANGGRARPPAYDGAIVLGVTGTAAAPLAPQYVLHFRRWWRGGVRVVMSRAAQDFVTPFTMRLYSGNDVLTDETAAAGDGARVPHIEALRGARLVVVLPATANILAKAAHGICDTVLSTTIVAATVPVVFVPSMNGDMWSNRVVQDNVARILELGHHVVMPEDGVEVVDMEPTHGVMPPAGTVLAALRDIVRDPGSTVSGVVADKAR